jgi:AraC-like DNA-binding protein
VSKDPSRQRGTPQALATRASASQVAPVTLLPLVAALKRSGHDMLAAFRGLGFDANDLMTPGFMPSQAEAMRFIRRALPMLGPVAGGPSGVHKRPASRLGSDPEWGLELGRRSQLMDRGALALGLMASPTLGEALALTLRYPASAGLLLALHAEPAGIGQSHVLRAEPLFDSDDLAPFLVDELFAGLVTQFRQLAAAPYAPILVELVRPAPTDPADLARWAAHFQCPVHFGCAHNRLVSDPAWMVHALPMAHPMSCRLARDLLDREADRSVNLMVTGLAVERAIRKALPIVVTPTQVAETLHLSERTLRRRLAGEGISYSALLDEGRRSLALALILHGRLTVSEVAAETGFADAGNFRRALKRWTGGVPIGSDNAEEDEAAAGGA